MRRRCHLLFVPCLPVSICASFFLLLFLQEDPDADGMPLPFGGRQLLDALALGQEDRARALLRHFRTDRRRARVLGATRVGRFGFTAAHVAAAGG